MTPNRRTYIWITSPSRTSPTLLEPRLSIRYNSYINAFHNQISLCIALEHARAVVAQNITSARTSARATAAAMDIPKAKEARVGRPERQAQSQDPDPTHRP